MDMVKVDVLITRMKYNSYLYYGNATGQSPINETWTFETSDLDALYKKDIIIAFHLTTEE